MIENFALIIRLIFVFDLRPAAKRKSGSNRTAFPSFCKKIKDCILRERGRPPRAPKTNSRKLTSGNSLEIPVTVSGAKYGKIRFSVPVVIARSAKLGGAQIVVRAL